jgi:hypothetical protein
MMSTLSACVMLAVTLMLTSPDYVTGHGRLLEPPSRSSMWRAGFQNPTNYDDNALNCGGLNVRITLTLSLPEGGWAQVAQLVSGLG